MVKLVRKRNYYSNRGKGYQFYKAIRAYHYAKLSTSTTIEYSGSSIKFAASNGSMYPLPDALQACSDYKSYSSLFLTFKVRAISIQITPMNPVGGFLGAASIIGLVAPGDSLTFSSLSESDQSLLMPYANFATKFFRTGFSWTPTDDTSNMSGAFGLAFDANSSSGAMRWGVKFTFYVLYKTNS